MLVKLRDSWVIKETTFHTQVKDKWDKDLLSSYGTNHTKLNILRVYPLCDNTHEMGTDTGEPIPVLLFTLYRNQHAPCVIIDIVTYALIFIIKCYFETFFLRTYVYVLLL